jgi:hypothetical protein
LDEWLVGWLVGEREQSSKQKGRGQPATAGVLHARLGASKTKSKQNQGPFLLLIFSTDFFIKLPNFYLYLERRSDVLLYWKQ